MCVAGLIFARVPKKLLRVGAMIDSDLIQMYIIYIHSIILRWAEITLVPEILKFHDYA